ncbi:hypothetical protein ACJW31_06G026200 [Castanea mollissima]
MDSLLSMEEEEEKSATIVAVEKILSYSFKDKALLVEALTHPAYYNYNNNNNNNNNGESFRSYQRLEFVGDVVLGLAVSKYLYLENPSVGPGQLTDLRSANVGNDKLARVAVRHGLHRYIRHNNNLGVSLLDEVQEFADEVSQEGDIVLHGSIKAPKVLADIVESLAAAIYFDLNFDLQKLWVCAKQGREVAIKSRRDGAKNIASVYVDGVFIASGSSNQLMEIAKLNAAKQALLELAKSPTNIGRLDFSFGLNKSLEIEGAKKKLQEFCQKKRWAIPSYSIVKEEGPPHAKKYVYLVQIETEDGGLCMEGEEKSKVKEAKNSAASCIIRALFEPKST